MKGAREYANMFKTGQHGRLYLVSSSHSIGYTFRIFVLPKGEDAIPNGSNAPLNTGAVEVYGVVNPGWDEVYGWIHAGKWQDDFNSLVESKKQQLLDEKEASAQRKQQKKEEEKQRVASLLSDY